MVVIIIGGYSYGLVFRGGGQSRKRLFLPVLETTFLISGRGKLKVRGVVLSEGKSVTFYLLSKLWTHG